jgi:hypothetical protein
LTTEKQVELFQHYGGRCWPISIDLSIADIWCVLGDLDKHPAQKVSVQLYSI